MTLGTHSGRSRAVRRCERNHHAANTAGLIKALLPKRHPAATRSLHGSVLAPFSTPAML